MLERRWQQERELRTRVDLERIGRGDVVVWKGGFAMNEEGENMFGWRETEVFLICILKICLKQFIDTAAI